MTRAEMLAHVRGNLLLDEGDPLTRWAGPSEEQALDTAADDTAQATDCYYAEQTTNIVSGQAHYCYPKIYKAKEVFLLNDDSVRVQVYPIGRIGRTLVNNVAPRQRFAAFGTGTPYCSVVGLQEIVFRTVPAADVSAGLIVAGFALPSLPKAGREKHQWDQGTDSCPLPAWAHNAVVLRATAHRCLQMAAKDRSFLSLMATYNASWEQACAEIATHARIAYRKRVHGEQP